MAKAKKKTPKKATTRAAPAKKNPAQKAARKAPTKQAPAKKTAAEPDLYHQIFANNKQWIAENKRRDPDFFKRLAREQNPEVLFIGCADSRVPANEIMGLEPGDVFVHRNIANIVPNTDLNVHSVIQYGVEVLQVKHVVVCGHYGCGGVAAAMKSQDLGQLNGWLREIRDVYRLHAKELDAIKNENTRYRRLVELNVQEQCVNVIKTAFVQKAYNARGFPIVHGWAYSLADGVLHDLKIPFRKILARIQQIYRLD